MRRIPTSALIAIAFTVAAITCASAQESYSYTETRTRTIPIDWRPEQKNYQRYTVSVSPLRVLSNGVKFDFERELPRPGQWLGTSLSMYFVPRRGGMGSELYNNRSSFISGFDDYHRMWGIGTSVIYKHTFSRRGWYFATGMTFDFYRVGVATRAFVPYREDGMTFYDYGNAIETRSFFKPTARFVMGKHMALSRRCFFDLYAGVGLSYSIYEREDTHDYTGSYDYRYGGYGYPRFDDVGGFGYRGLTIVSGFRFGVLLWKELQ